MIARLLLAFTLLSAPLLALADPSFIYVVRHGEKEAGGTRDPALTAQGQARAHRIAAMLRPAGIVSVFSSQTTRTMQTARPMAQAAGVDVQAYDAGKPEALAERLHAIDGGAVLIVGHSNTVPALVRLLGGASGADIADDEYDRVYQLSKGPSGAVQTVVLSSLGN